ncbi:reverse transcriptase domain-containing protein [Tanacetum coccineum]
MVKANTSRPYCTHPNGSRKLLTARKRVGPYPARRLAWRRVSHRSSDRYYSPDFTSDSSSLGSSSDSSSDISSGSSSDSLSDSSSVHSSGSAPLSTLYPPTTSESSPDSSSKRSLYSSSPSARRSCNRCRSPTTLVPSSTPILRSIAPALTDLSPRKRFRDSYSFEVSGEEHMKIGTTDAETVADSGISKGVGAHTEDGLGMGVEVATSDIREDGEEFKAKASARGTTEIVGRFFGYWITEFETAQRQLEASQLEASRERAGLAYRIRSLGRENLRVRRNREDTRRRLGRIMTNTRSGMTPVAIEEMINRRVTKALETREANRNIRLGNGNNEGGNGNGNGNGNGRGNRSGIHNENDRDARPWNSHKRTIGADAALAMSWRELMKLMAEVYYPRTKIQKMEYELWNLTMKNNDLAAYTQRFQDLTMLCTKMVPEEEDRVEMFIRGLPDNIQGNVIAAEPIRLQDVVRMANNLMDQKLKGYAMKNTKNKRKFDNSQKDNRGQQPPFKRQNVGGQDIARAYPPGP